MTARSPNSAGRTAGSASIRWALIFRKKGRRKKDWKMVKAATAAAVVTAAAVAAAATTAAVYQHKHQNLDRWE